MQILTDVYRVKILPLYINNLHNTTEVEIIKKNEKFKQECRTISPNVNGFSFVRF